MKLRLGSACLVAAALGLLWSTPAIAAKDTGGSDAAGEMSSGFGERDSFVLSLERMFGFQQQKTCGDSCQTLDSIGLHPFYWGHLGLFSMRSNGLNFGALVGFTYLDEFIGDEAVAIMRLGPRVGYAGALQKTVGYWLRGGPSFFAIFTDGDDTTTLAGSIEALAVVTPAPHMGILFGPNVDIHIWGKSGDEDAEFSSIGLSAGLMGEF
ncbi:MAG: hypothetical protein R3B13_02780 [Polyangiaceae bacterium]